MIKKNIKKEAYLLPIYLCLFFVPVFYFPYFLNSFTQSKELLFKTIIILSLPAVVIYNLYQNRFKINKFFKNKLFLLLFGIFTIITLAVVMSPTPKVAIHGTYDRGFGYITQIYLALFFLYSVSVLNKNQVKKGLLLIFLSGLLIAIYAIIQKTGFDPLFYNFDTDIFIGRSFSLLGNPGYLGQFMTLAIILTAYFFFKSKKQSFKALYASGFFIMILALMFSETRAAILSMFLSVFLIAIKYRKNILKYLKKIKRYTIWIIGLILVFLSISLVILAGNERFSLSVSSIRSLNSRFEIWNGAIELIKEKPLIGYGQETFYIYAPEIITKEFLTLEESIHISIDKIHNEFLETVFSYGIFAGLLYIIIFAYLLYLFFKTKNSLIAILSLIVIANVVQNQFSFSDFSISVVIAFSLASIIAIQSKKSAISINIKKKFAHLLTILLILFSGLLFIHTIYKPLMSQWLYYKSREHYNTNYEKAINLHKQALEYTPYYSKLWYELMFLDRSSMEKALHHLEQIEGNSGDLLAWKGNFYSVINPSLSSDYFYKALKKNPHYPDWIRAHADMLYKNGDYRSALYLYNKYLEYVPDFWKWEDVEKRTKEEQKSYRIFFKNTPDFWKTVERVKELGEIINKEENHAPE